MPIQLNSLFYFVHKLMQLITLHTSITADVEVVQPVSYHGAQVWRMPAVNSTDFQFLASLADNDDVSIWSSPRSHIDFLIKADKIVKVKKTLKERGKKYTILHHDVQKSIDMTKPKEEPWTTESLRVGHQLNWASYPTLGAIDGYFKYLQYEQTKYCKVIKIGTTAEKREIRMVKISNGNPKNKVMFITGGMHGREWTCISSAFYLLDKICTQFESQPDHVKNMDWYIIPLVNPDGYQYTQIGDRYWRKNRRKYKDHFCIGVDLNRNFEAAWGGMDSLDPCKETYGGMYAFSEDETSAIKEAYQKHMPKTPAAYMDLHAYGQKLIFPWAADHAPVKNYDQLKKVCHKISKAISDTTQTRYLYDSVPEIMYIASGVGIDWIYALGTPLSIAMENRDKGAHGFGLPNNLIAKAGADALVAATTLALCVDMDCEKG